CDLALGRHEQVLGELQVLVGEHPLRERLRAQQMLALYRAGRQAEALEAYQQAREVLVEELGIEPSPALQRLQQGILRHDPSLETASGTAAANGLAPTRPFREQGTALDEQPARWPRVRVRRRYLVATALVVLAAAAGLTALATRANGTPRVVANSLVRLDPASGKLVSVVRVGVEPGPIAITPTAIWTSNYGDNTVSRYDLRTHTVEARAGFPAQPFDTVVDGDGNAWITSSYEDNAPAQNAFLTRLEAGTGGTSPGTLYPSHAQTIDLPLPMAGYETLGGGYLWVIVGGHGPLFGDDRVARVDLGTNQVASVLQLHHSATSIAFGYGSAWIGTYTSGGNSCCGPHLLEWDASLFTQRGEVEVDLLAGHQPLAERHDIRERHRESYRRPERRQASRHGSSRGGFPTPRRRRRRKPWPRPREQDQEMQKELHLVGRSHSVPALASETDRHRLKETVGYEGLE